jgi:hypothetical protein
VSAGADTAQDASSDAILVSRIAAGDKLAMQALFARHRTLIYRWLLRFVGNETNAEDLAAGSSGCDFSRAHFVERERKPLGAKAVSPCDMPA